jgi:rubrerythrin
MGTIFDPSEIFQLAVRIEENGENFYRKMAEKFDDIEVKELFTFLANEEIGHKKFYNELLKEFKTYDPPSEYATEYYEFISTYADEVMFNTKDFEEYSSKVTDIISALNFAIDSELHAVLYFSEMKHLVSQEKRDIIDNIIEEERKHFVKLSNMKKIKEKK